jgi:hypothetical protein
MKTDREIENDMQESRTQRGVRQGGVPMNARRRCLTAMLALAVVAAPALTRRASRWWKFGRAPLAVAAKTGSSIWKRMVSAPRFTIPATRTLVPSWAYRSNTAPVTPPVWQATR